MRPGVHESLLANGYTGMAYLHGPVPLLEYVRRFEL